MVDEFAMDPRCTAPLLLRVHLLSQAACFVSGNI